MIIRYRTNNTFGYGHCPTSFTVSNSSSDCAGCAHALAADTHCRLGFVPLLQSMIDGVFESDQKAHHHKRSGWKYRHQKARIVVEDLPLAVFGNGAEQQLHIERDIGGEVLHCSLKVQ